MDFKIALYKVLLSGPNLLNNIDDVLLRYRSGLYPYSGDGTQMFLRIRLDPKDAPYHCFLWRLSPTDPPTAYQFQVHVFGNTGSPFVAVFVVQEHARKYLDRWPAAVDTLIRSTLIDDVLDSADTVEEARQCMRNITTILHDAGMKFAKCHSNSLSVLSGLPPDAISPGFVDIASICQKDDQLVNLKALGIRCDPIKDEFFFVMEHPTPDKWTKRWVLKTFPRLFDPLGFLLPYTITARIYFSQLVLQAEPWDKPIVPGQEWIQWLSELQELERVRFPRCIKMATPVSAQLHVFSDASEKSFAAAAYLRTTDAARNVTVRLVRAKAHVAPLRKPQTIPRLELLAAELSANLRVQVTKAIKISISRSLHWVDSTTVLYWINDDKKRFQTFVYNKLANIRSVTREEEWRYVPTDKNPADLPTRGTAPKRLGDSLWQNGPAFLLQDKDQWPMQPPLVKTSEVLQELRKSEQVFNTTTPAPAILDFTKISQWGAAVRAVRLVWNAIRRWKSARGELLSPVTWTQAELVVVRQAQSTFDSLLTASNKVRLKELGFSRIIPFCDEQGLWRGRGRLSAVKDLSLDAKHPLLMPRNHPATALLLRHFHSHVAHHYGGTNYLLARFYTRFWTPLARAKAAALAKACVPCKRRLARPVRLPEAPLPGFRTLGDSERLAPFSSTGMDCAGPFRVLRGRSYESHYLLLLTCCKIRAVRLEPLTALSVDALLMALNRAAARGVNPEEIVTDNGANFTAAYALLQKLAEAAQALGDTNRLPDIKWRFNPPYASHYGGVFETMIRAAKEALYHALPTHLTLTLEQLHTAFANVEAILNARPLGYVTSELQDPLPLTPNHFLYGTGNLDFHVRLQSDEAELPLAKRYNTLRRAMAQFEGRFRAEIRPYLQLSNKAVVGNRGRGIQPGDVVVYFADTAARKWPLAIVEQIYPGADGVVRTVKLRAPLHNAEKGTYNPQRSRIRDVRDIALLLPGQKDKIAS